MTHYKKVLDLKILHCITAISLEVSVADLAWCCFWLQEKLSLMTCPLSELTKQSYSIWDSHLQSRENANLSMNKQSSVHWCLPPKQLQQTFDTQAKNSFISLVAAVRHVFHRGLVNPSPKNLRPPILMQERVSETLQMSEASTASSDQDIAVLQFETLGHGQTKVGVLRSWDIGRAEQKSLQDT